MVTETPRVVPVTAFGRRFRSTTEARWATCLTALGVAWEYEPETYDLGPVGWYMPDFWLPGLPASDGSAGVFLEVKHAAPVVADRDYDKARGLHAATRRPVLIALGYGVPPLMMGRSDFPGALYDVFSMKDDARDIPSADSGGPGHHLTVCVCGQVGIGYGGWISTCRKGEGHRWDERRLVAAHEEGTSFRADSR